MKKIIVVLITLILILTFSFSVFAAPADGEYTIEATLSGSSHGRTIESPSSLSVSGGQMTAVIVIDSVNFTYMEVDGVQYYNTNSGGYSTFEIPVSALDTEISVNAETVAMSSPQVIEYKIYFDSSTLSVVSLDSTGEVEETTVESTETTESGQTTNESSETAENNDETTEVVDETTEVVDETTEVVDETTKSADETTDIEDETKETEDEEESINKVLVIIVILVIIAAILVIIFFRKRKLGDKK